MPKLTAQNAVALLDKQEQITILTMALVHAHEGQIRFNMAETSKILGICERNVASKLHEAGFLVSRNGHKKYINAADLAAYCVYENIAPIDNRWANRRGA